MEFTIVRDEGSVIEIEAQEKDPGLFPLIAERLNKEKEVVFAAYKWEHPVLSKPRLIIKVKKGKAKTALKKVIEGIEKDIAAIEKALSSL